MNLERSIGSRFRATGRVLVLCAVSLVSNDTGDQLRRHRPGDGDLAQHDDVGDVDPLSFPRIKRRRDLLPDHDDGVKVIRPRFGDELAKQPGRDAADCSQLLGIQQRPG